MWLFGLLILVELLIITVYKLSFHKSQHFNVIINIQVQILHVITANLFNVVLCKRTWTLFFISILQYGSKEYNYHLTKLILKWYSYKFGFVLEHNPGLSGTNNQCYICVSMINGAWLSEFQWSMVHGYQSDY